MLTASDQNLTIDICAAGHIPSYGDLMNKLLLIITTCFLAVSSFANETYTGKVVKLADGDTLQFLPSAGGKPFKVRMIAIDTAETHFSTPKGGTLSQGYWGEMGAKQLEKFVAVGDEAELEVYGEDRYGRKLGRVFKNGEDLNLKMIRSGWAALYMICDANKPCKSGALSQQDLKKYREACMDAVQEGLGLFDASNPVPELPFLFRASAAGNPPNKFVADLSSGTYVNPAEFPLVNVCNRLFYYNQADAVQNGFNPK